MDTQIKAQKQQDVIEGRIRKYRLACLLYIRNSCAKTLYIPVCHPLRVRLVDVVAYTNSARLIGYGAKFHFEGCLLII